MSDKLIPQKDQIAACYYCFHMYHSHEIVRYIDDGRTPVCPVCDIDAVEFYSTYMSVADILIDLDNRAKIAWAIVDDDGTPTGDHMMERFRSDNEAK